MCTFIFLEIPNLFTEEECEYFIEMAQTKGLHPSPLVKDNSEISDKTSENTFMEWDINGDGFVDTDEVRLWPTGAHLQIAIGIDQLKH